MSFWAILYSLTIKPFQLFFEVIYTITNNNIKNPGLSIVVLSLTMNFLVLPLYKRADAVQEEERIIENKLHDGVAHIRKHFKGDEKMMILQTYYRQNNYRPTDVFKGSVSLFLEIPFFVAAYQFLSHLTILQGVSFGFIKDLGAADELIRIGALSVNLLPIIMTAVNLVSCFIFTKGYPLKTKIQLFGMAVFFFFFLYKSPSGLVFYWTLNNIFSLVKTIFYKLKNPKKVLNIMFSVFGLSFLCILPFVWNNLSNSFVGVVIAIIGFVMIMPLALSLMKKVWKKKISLPKIESNSLTFFMGAVYMAILTGGLIPSGVIMFSPQEFVDLYNYKDPRWLICSSLCLAVGLLVIWLGVFYKLADSDKRYIFDILIWALCGVATVDFLFFGKNLGIMSNTLKYTTNINFSLQQKLINLLVILSVIVAFAAIIYLLKKNVHRILLVGIASVTLMSILYFIAIDVSIGEVKDTVEIVESDENYEPSFTLSRNGKNVVVIMLDRAMGEYMPYFLNEKPELKDIYSGFTYYPNTVSFGAYTNVGAIPLYGGYEYTPTEINLRDKDTLVEKHNEALRVMPVIFDQYGYDVTVCDPTYAGYDWTPNLSIYDDYNDIQKYITNGYYWDNRNRDDSVSDVSYKTTKNMRNFFLYAIMKESPLFIQEVLYDEGRYNEASSYRSNSSNVSSEENEGVMKEDDFKSYEISSNYNDTFMRAYYTLDNYSTMTHISDTSEGAFVMISNDTTHEPIALQEPDYLPTGYIDNTEYEMNHADRFEVDGKSLVMEDDEQYASYQTNMGALLCLGKWLEYLKEEGVYDNTRIIIVADHGRNIGSLEDMMYYDDNYPLKNSNKGVNKDGLLDLEFFYPLLLVKDFNSTEFSISEEFMTNADTPTLAFQDIILNPVNPFTGKQINSSEKTAHPQRILGNSNWNLADKKETVFKGGIWYTVHTDMRKRENWTLIEDNR